MCRLYCGPQQQEELELELDPDFCLVSYREKIKKLNCQSSPPSLLSPLRSSLPTSPKPAYNISVTFFPAGINAQQRASCSGSSTPLFLAGTKPKPVLFIFIFYHYFLFSSLECVDAGVSPRIESLANNQSQFSLSLFLPSEL